MLINDVISTFTRMVPYRFTGEMRACELCGGADHEVVGRRDRYGHALRTVLCRGCGLVFTNPMPTPAELDQYYRIYYRKHYQNAFQPTKKHVIKSTKGARNRCRDLRPLLGPGTVAVDVGAGGGEFVHELQSQGVDAVGIEPNQGFATYARQRYGVRILIAGWQDADIAPDSVDVITANHVLEHFHDPLAAMERFRSWLKVGGRLFVSVPEIENPERTPYGRFHFAHLYNFNHASLVMMALKAGFDVKPDFANPSTTLVFDKLEKPVAEWMRFPGNYAQLSRFFRTYTNRRYFLSWTPYHRWFRRMFRLGSVMVGSYFVSEPGGGRR